MKTKISSEVIFNFCSAVMDTGYSGSAEEYCREFLLKELQDIPEQDLIAKTKELEQKKGSLKEWIRQ
jgi:hypothetical protein